MSKKRVDPVRMALQQRAAALTVYDVAMQATFDHALLSHKMNMISHQLGAVNQIMIDRKAGGLNQSYFLASLNQLAQKLAAAYTDWRNTLTALDRQYNTVSTPGPMASFCATVLDAINAAIGGDETQLWALFEARNMADRIPELLNATMPTRGRPAGMSTPRLIIAETATALQATRGNHPLTKYDRAVAVKHALRQQVDAGDDSDGLLMDRTEALRLLELRRPDRLGGYVDKIVRDYHRQ